MLDFVPRACTCIAIDGATFSTDCANIALGVTMLCPLNLYVRQKLVVVEECASFFGVEPHQIQVMHSTYMLTMRTNNYIYNSLYTLPSLAWHLFGQIVDEGSTQPCCMSLTPASTIALPSDEAIPSTRMDESTGI